MTDSAQTSRRTLVRTAAWSTPVIATIATAPAFATSLRKDPGINGWVLVSTDRDDDRYSLRFDSDEPGTGPDGAPYGLYVYDPNRNGNTLLDTYTNASITFWIRDNTDKTPLRGSWSTVGSGSGWGSPTTVAAQTKPDGLTYRGYRFNYSGAYTLVAAEERVYLSDLIASGEFNGNDPTYWVERAVTVNGTVRSFQRRNGARGPMGEGFPGGNFRTTQRAPGVGVPA